MDLNVRRNQIMQLLQENNSMSVEDIAKHFEVTPTSIRRDLAYLEENNFITRSRGYAQISDYPNVSDFNIRSNFKFDEKMQIAKKAIEYISSRDTIILDSGTTTLALAQQLRTKDLQKLNIITNSIPIAVTLSSKFQVFLSGGVVQEDNMALIGPETDHYFRSVSCDKVFIGATGIRQNQGLTASSPFHVSVKKQMIEAAREVYALIDSSKFNVSGVNVFCEFQYIDHLITIRTPENENILNEINKMGVDVIYAND